VSAVAVIGVGRMGGPLARGWAARHDVVVWDTAPARRAAAGVPAAASAADAVREAEVVVTVLPGTPELERLLTDLPLRPGCCWIDMTSTAPDVARRLAAEQSSAGVDVLDAAIGGGPAQAAGGTLRLFVGGDPVVLRRWRPLLGEVSGTIEHVGAAGTGVLVKLLVNLLWFGQAALTAEAALLARSAGIDAGRFLRLVQDGPAGSRFLDRDFPAVLRGDYLASFGLDRIVEELDSLRTDAARAGSPFDLGAALTAQYEAALARLGPIDGELAIVADLERRAGRELRDPAGVVPPPGGNTVHDVDSSKGTVMSIHALTNLASGHSFELSVPTGVDPAGLARAFLADQGLTEDEQAGFYVSVYPVSEADEELVANVPSNLDSSPNDTPYDSQ
jgi:3-hydroxyisobutyrate dehydrogenase-like beta-hydroxyacid dehydrogenase